MSPRILAADGREVTEAEKWQTFEHINTDVEMRADEFVCEQCNLVAHKSGLYVTALPVAELACRDCWGDK